MLYETVFALTALVLFAFAADFLLALRDDPREPRRLRASLPLIGHLLGMLRHGPTYYNKLSQTTAAEVYAMPLLHTKIYVVSSSRLLIPVQKQSKNLSFRPFLQIVARKYGDASPEAYDVFGGALPDDLSHSVKMNLAPGLRLDDLSLRMGERVLIDMSLLLDSRARYRGRQIHLLNWSRHAVIQATSCAVYGKTHPWLDPDVEQAFWKWQKYLTAHLTGWMDIFGTGYAARQKVFDAYIRWRNEISGCGSSQLAKDHERVLQDAGVSDLDRAKQSAIFTIASYSNSAPTLYWTIWELFSRSEVLQNVRQELIAHAISGSKKDGFVLDVAKLKSRCFLLASVFQETQRTRHVNPSFRKVMSDVLLDDKYLLKKGYYLQIPGLLMHIDKCNWGRNAAEFDPYRFVPKDAEKGGPSTSNNFVPWGAAPFMCPARQFAATEILIVSALLAMRAELSPTSTGGVWDQSPALNYEDLSTLPNPKKDVQLDVRVREEWAGEWTLKMGESRTRISLASG